MTAENLRTPPSATAGPFLDGLRQRGATVTIEDETLWVRGVTITPTQDQIVRQLKPALLQIVRLEPQFIRLKLQEVLGHASAMTTRAIDTHVMPERRRDVMAPLQDYFPD